MSEWKHMISAPKDAEGFIAMTASGEMVFVRYEVPIAEWETMIWRQIGTNIVHRADMFMWWTDNTLPPMPELKS